MSTTPRAAALRDTTERATTLRDSRTPRLTDRVSIIGLGYVGLPLAILARERGLDVRGFDVDTEKNNHIRKGSVSYLTPEESASLRKHPFTVGHTPEVLTDANSYIVCVPTPVNEDGEPDLAPLEAACRSIAPHLSRGNLVVIESTVNPGACERVALSILEQGSGLKGERDFFFAHCPERINPGDERWDVRTIPRVLGGLGPKSLARAKQFYESVIDGEIFPMNSIKEAEAVKMVENTFRDVNIAFVNELAMSFDKAGIDLTNVLQGAKTKPFGFVPFTPGCGVGGHCIPVDPYYLIKYGRENGFEHRFLVTARKINGAMPIYTVERLQDALTEHEQELAGSTIALLGLSYKRDVPDMRESPALEIKEELEARGAYVQVFDPLVPEESTAQSLDEALEGADAVVIATDHEEFCGMSPYEFLAHDIRIVIDGRNCLSKADFEAAHITYRGIGR
jgi:UDP-N-acetyl-D-glucosamine dehydrogenase